MSPNFLVKTPVRKDDKSYEPGDTVQLSQKEADAMGDDVVAKLNDKGTKEATS